MFTDNDNINYLFQTLPKIPTKEKALKSHSNYKESSKMYLIKSDALMEHYHYRSNQITSHTRQPKKHSICPEKPSKES